MKEDHNLVIINWYVYLPTSAFCCRRILHIRSRKGLHMLRLISIEETVLSSKTDNNIFNCLFSFRSRLSNDVNTKKHCHSFCLGENCPYCEQYMTVFTKRIVRLCATTQRSIYMNQFIKLVSNPFSFRHIICNVT